MTPYEFGCRVKIAVETGGLFEYMGQGADNGVKSFNKAIGMPQFSPQSFGGSSGGGAMPPAAAPSASYTRGPGPSASAPMPASMRAPVPQPPTNYTTGPTANVATPAPPPAVKPTPRPAAVKPAPAQPKPTAPGVRKSGSRIA